MHKGKLQQHLTGEITQFPNSGKVSIPLRAALEWCQSADHGRESAVSAVLCWLRSTSGEKHPLCTAGWWSLEWSLGFSHILCLFTVWCVLTMLCLFLTGGSLLPVSFYVKTLSELAEYEIQKVVVQLPCLHLLSVAKYYKIGYKFRRLFFFISLW